MAFNQSNFGKSSNFASSRNVLNQTFDSPLSQPRMTQNAGATPLKNRPPMHGFGISTVEAGFNCSSNFALPNAMFQSNVEEEMEEEYKPDSSSYGSITRAIQENEYLSRMNSQKSLNEGRSRLNSQRSLNGDQLQ